MKLLVENTDVGYMKLLVENTDVCYMKLLVGSTDIELHEIVSRLY